MGFAVLNAAAARCGVARTASAGPSALRRPLASRPPLATPRPLAIGSQRATRSVVMAATLQELEKEKLITRIEMPVFIQRDDFIDQLYRWSMNIGEIDAGRNIGMAFKVEPLYSIDPEGNDILWGWQTSFVKAGDVTCELFCGFDDETAQKYRWVGRDMETGMPKMDGDSEDVAGKNFEMWKLGKGSVDDETKAAIKVYCGELADAINKYYAFGSCWAEDI